MLQLPKQVSSYSWVNCVSNSQKAIATLTALFHLELAAVETHDKAFDPVSQIRRITLIGSPTIHSRRKTLLNQRHYLLGSNTLLTVDQWYVQVTVVTTGRRFLGEMRAIVASVDGQSSVRETCRIVLAKAETPVSHFAVTQLNHKMNRAHDTISVMLRQLGEIRHVK